MSREVANFPTIARGSSQSLTRNSPTDAEPTWSNRFFSSHRILCDHFWWVESWRRLLSIRLGTKGDLLQPIFFLSPLIFLDFAFFFYLRYLVVSRFL